MERVTFALLLAYDGSPYKGWQKQADLPTVMGVLEGGLRRLGIGASPFGASRTDAGVHAEGQVASFSTKTKLTAQEIERGLNADLPQTLRVVAVKGVPRSFHAHWSSVGKIYRYRISFRGEARSWRVPAERLTASRLQRDRLAEALREIVAAPDLAALCSRDDGDKKRTVRRAALVACDEGGATLELEGAAFGKHEVRYLVSSALAYATDGVDLPGLRRIFSGEEPRPVRAEADGLTLVKVLYPPGVDPFL